MSSERLLTDQEMHDKLKFVRANSRLPMYLETELAQVIRHLALRGSLCTCEAPADQRHHFHCATQAKGQRGIAK